VNQTFVSHPKNYYGATKMRRDL